MLKPLTAVAVNAAKPQAGKRYEIADGAMRGLYLIIQPSGVKSWALRHKVGGRPVKMTLGPAAGPGALTLAEAREQAGAARKQLAQGVDPVAARKEAKAAEAARREAERMQAEGEAKRDHLRVEAVVADFVARHVEPRLKSRVEVSRILRKEVAGPWKGKLITEIGRKDVVALVDKIADRGAGIVANRTLARLRELFNWSVDRGLVEMSPCAGVRAPSLETARDRTLSDAELRLVLLGAERLGWPWREFFTILALTGQRREECAGLRWDELDGLDGDAPTWTLPSARTKNARQHTLPLAPAVVEIIRSTPRIDGSAFVFSTGRRRKVPAGDDGRPAPVSGFSKAKRLLDAAIVEVARERGLPTIAPWRVHDLRRTVASGMARQGQPVHVVEAVLNHRSGTVSGVAAIYNRYDYAAEKHAALMLWAEHVEKLTRPAK